MNTKTEPKNKLDETLTVLESGQNKSLSRYVPDGESPKLYLQLIKDQIFAPDNQGNQRPTADLLLFLYHCKRTGLDPLAKQIYAIYRWDTRLGREKMTIQSSIDGYRLVAQRTGEYGGSDDAVFDSEDKEHPNKATVTVYKINKITGERMPITATARWNEYVQTTKDNKPANMWAKMPYNQLAKCAEALALRKAFPNELGGIYTDDEMQQSNNPLANLPAPEKKEDNIIEAKTVDEKADLKSMRAKLKEGENE